VQQGVRVILVDLQAEQEELVRRMQSCDSHYMKSEMVDSQLAIYSAPSAGGDDVFPLNAGLGIEEVIDEIETFLTGTSA
jgi:gluconate kinase